MTIPLLMSSNTPSTSAPHVYECLECGNRLRAEHQPVECPNCGGQMQNIEQSRE